MDPRTSTALYAILFALIFTAIGCTPADGEPLEAPFADETLLLRHARLPLAAPDHRAPTATPTRKPTRGPTRVPTTADTVPKLIRISEDPFKIDGTDDGQHKTQVEPANMCVDRTIVHVVQTGRRVTDGGAVAISFATSDDLGRAWTQGMLPHLTSLVGGGPSKAGSDPTVGYSAKHKLWLAVVLVFNSFNDQGLVKVSRAADGRNWGYPITIVSGNKTACAIDKPWIGCDNTPTSRYYGRCYVTYDCDDGHPRTPVFVATSTDGGATWSAPVGVASALFSDGVVIGLGGIPLVLPSGTVVIPLLDTPNGDNSSAGGYISAFRSRDGGASWGEHVRIARALQANVPNIRQGILPSAAVDSSGRVYVVWNTCLYRKDNCGANDLVISSSADDGATWTKPSLIPIQPNSSTANLLIPGLAATGKGTLALTFYVFAGNCNTSCRVSAGFITSTNGGKTWSKPVRLAGPFKSTWLAKTGIGLMVGDYITTCIAADGMIFPSIVVASKPLATGQLRQSLHTVSGLTLATAANLPPLAF